jgi:hypothetical protein
MSDAVSVGTSAPAGGSAPAASNTGGQAASSAAPSASHAYSPGSSAQSGQSEPQMGHQPTPAARELGDSDLDALVSVQIDGKVQKVSLKELQKGYQLETAARKRMTEAQKALGRAKQIEQMLENDPAALFKAIGKDFDQLAEERLAAKYEEMQLTPEQRELKTLKDREQARERAEMQSKRA